MKKQLPLNWTKEPFSSIAEIVTGATPSKKNMEFYGGDIPFITPAQLNNEGKLFEASIFLSHKGVKKARLLPKDSVLITCIGTLGKVAIANKPLVTNQQINSLILDTEKVYPKYAYHYCRRLKPVLDSLAPSTTVAIINKTRFSELEIPLPPLLAEQKRIAAILDKADAIRRKRQATIKLSDDFLRATFLDMFGDPVTNPKEWKRLPLKNVLERIDSGWSPKCNREEPGDDEWGVLKLSAVTSCNFLEHECKALPPDLSPKPNLEVHKGDLLFTRKNTHDLVAACALIHSTRSKLLLSDLIFRLVIKDDAQVVSAYLWALLTHPGKRKQIQGISGGAAGSMPNISKGRLLEQKIEIPDINLQKRFSLFLCKFIRLKDKLLESAINTDLTLNSLTQRAFRGEL